jgi:hypothetical protein
MPSGTDDEVMNLPVGILLCELSRVRLGVGVAAGIDGRAVISAVQKALPVPRSGCTADS